MKLGTIIILVSFFLLELLLRKKFPDFCKRIQLPVNIIAGILALSCCALLIYALYQVLNSAVSGGDKLFFALLVLAALGAFAYMAASLWRQWLKQGKDTVKVIKCITGIYEL